MLNKVEKRKRRAYRGRKKMTSQSRERLCVHRTLKHIYAQVINIEGGQVIASASTLEPDVRKELKSGGNVTAAAVIGKRIAEKAKKAGVTKVAFDRSGYKYHGRVKALADAAREGGLEF